jgi:GTPase Era involved in 16S rRNA processing
MMEGKVYLELWVKVWEQWRKKDSRLRYLGYALPPQQRPTTGKRRK